MMAETETVWFRILLPAGPSTGGLSQTSYCMVCGAAIVVTQDDTRPAVFHIDYHVGRGESP